MKLPFQLTNTFTTPFSPDEIIEFVKLRLNRRSKLFSFNQYTGSVNESEFRFYKSFNPRFGCSNAVISGLIISSNPTIITITISPHYFRIIFFLIFPIVFIPTAIFSNQMIINGVYRQPTLSERMLFILGGIAPIVWGYIDSIKPIKEAQTWIKSRLMLKAE